MKIHIRSEDHNFTIPLATNFVFSKGTVWLFNHVGRKYAGDAMKAISPEALERLFAELRHIKRKYGHWTLVEIHSADGEEVTVTL